MSESLEKSLAEKLDKMLELQTARLAVEKERLEIEKARNALMFEQNRQLAKANALATVQIRAISHAIQLKQGLVSKNEEATVVYGKLIRDTIQEYSRENYPKLFEEPEQNPVQ